jgi:transposase
MKQYNEAFVGIDTAKNRHAVAIADAGREGEIRYLGEIDSAPAAVERMIRKLADRYKRLHFCYEAGPTGYGLYRQVRALGHDCIVVAPSLVPKRPGERVKTNRRDAVTLARLLRAGDLTPVWVPDAVHEAVRDLVRARTAASQDLRRKRQQLLSFFAASRTDLQWPRALDPGASALAGATKVRSPDAADCFPGRGGHDRGRRDPFASPR